MRVTWNMVSPLDRVFDDVMGSMLGTATSPRTFEPSVDVRSNDHEVIFLCDVPGLKNEDLEITIDHRVLSISGTQKFESSQDEQVLLGRAYGTFRRRFELPDDVDHERLTANRASDRRPVAGLRKHSPRRNWWKYTRLALAHEISNGAVMTPGHRRPGRRVCAPGSTRPSIPLRPKVCHPHPENRNESD